MKRLTKNYDEGTFGKMRRVRDFLPSPDELAKAESRVKVTLTLSGKSLEFFKAQARKHNTSYQRMIRKLLDKYVQQQ